MAKYNSRYPTSKGAKIETEAASSSAGQSGFDAHSSDDDQSVVSEESEGADTSALDSEKPSTMDDKEREHSPLSKVSQSPDIVKSNVEPGAESDNNKGKIPNKSNGIRIHFHGQIVIL